MESKSQTAGPIPETMGIQDRAKYPLSRLKVALSIPMSGERIARMGSGVQTGAAVAPVGAVRQ